MCPVLSPAHVVRNEKRSVLYEKGHEGKEIVSVFLAHTWVTKVMIQWASYIFFSPLSCSCSTLTTTSVHELSSEITFYLKACFESSRWMKLWNIKDAISHRETVVYQSLMIRACWNIHIPCLPSNYSPWDLYKKSGLTASRMLWNDAGFGAVRYISKYQVIQQTTILFPLMLERLRWQEAGIFSEQINSFDSQLWGNLQFNTFNLLTVHSSLQEWYRSQTLNTKCLLQLTIFRWQKREGHFSTLKNNTSAKTLHFFHAIKKSFWFCFCL